jgi:hypothetical protein
VKHFLLGELNIGSGRAQALRFLNEWESPDGSPRTSMLYSVAETVAIASKA